MKQQPLELTPLAKSTRVGWMLDLLLLLFELVALSSIPIRWTSVHCYFGCLERSFQDGRTQKLSLLLLQFIVTVRLHTVLIKLEFLPFSISKFLCVGVLSVL